jgi:hypothetical protein
MVYGRLDVFSPDGTFATFPLQAARTSIGRSNLNTIAIDNETIAAKHTEITFSDGQACLVDSQSQGGTFVDGRRLEKGESRPLYGGEEIFIGNLRLIYHFYDDTPTRPVIVPEEATQRIEAKTPDFVVDVFGPEQAVAPGAHVAAQLAISNTSPASERYRIEVSGLPRDWLRVDRTEIEVAPGQIGDVIINFKPTRRPESTPGKYKVVIITRASRAPDAALRCEVVLEVLPFGGFGMALEETHLQAGERFRLYIHNQGSAVLPLTLTARDKLHKLRFSLPTPNLTLAPGQRRVVEGTAQARALRLWGKKREHAFDLVIRSQDAAAFTAAVRGFVTVKPAVPRWAPVALLSLFGVAALMLALLFMAVRSTPTLPRIQSVNLSSVQVTQGDPLTLSWDVDNADSLELLANGVVVSEGIDPLAGSLAIDTEALQGPVLITLRARNANGAQEANQVIQIDAPMAVGYFTVEPEQLVRYVVQTITVNWSVSGAKQTQISGFETFSSSQLASSYGASGTVAFAGMATAPLQIVLTARDERDRTIDTRLDIAVIDPICQPASADVTLYAEPSAESPIVGTVMTESSVTVDAQNETGQWLRVVLSGNIRGWGARSLFVCENTFDPGQLQKIIQLPPQATPTGIIPQTALPAVTPVPITPVAPTATARFGG